MVAALQPVPAACKFVHLREQRQRLRQRLREIEDAVRIKRLTVVAQRNLIHALHRARQHGIQVASEAFQDVRNLVADTKYIVSMDLPRVGRAAVFSRIAVESLARLIVLIEKVVFDAVEDPSGKPWRGNGATRDLAEAR